MSADPDVYFPLAQAPEAELSLLVKTAADRATALGVVRSALRELDSRFAKASGQQEIFALLREIERLTFQETQDWLGLMSFARLEPI